MKIDFYFENELHYFNVCKKVLRQNYSIEDISLIYDNHFREFCNLLFRLSYNNYSAYRNLGLKEPTWTFISFIKYSSNIKELFEKLILMVELVESYQAILHDPDPSKICKIVFLMRTKRKG